MLLALDKAFPGRQAQEEALDALVARYARQARGNWDALLEALREALPPGQVEALLESGRLSEIARRLDEAQAGPLAVLAATAAAALVAAGALVASQTQQRLRAPLAFDTAADPVVQAIRQHRLHLVREIGPETRAGIMQHLIDGVRRGVPRRTLARRIRPLVGLTRRQEKAVANYRRALETLDRAALERVSRDRRFDSTVGRALRDGQPLKPQQVDRMVDRFRDKMIKRRAERIAGEEMERAVNTGQHTALQQTQAQTEAAGLVQRRFWVHRGDGRVRAAHVRIPGINPQGVALDEPFRTPLGPLLYPHDPNGTAENTVGCRCRVAYRLVPIDQLQEQAA